MKSSTFAIDFSQFSVLVEKLKLWMNRSGKPRQMTGKIKGAVLLRHKPLSRLMFNSAYRSKTVPTECGFRCFPEPPGVPACAALTGNANYVR
jgi:hypothetical protein